LISSGHPYGLKRRYFSKLYFGQAWTFFSCLRARWLLEEPHQLGWARNALYQFTGTQPIYQTGEQGRLADLTRDQIRMEETEIC
jgi:hypothetical protein